MMGREEIGIQKHRTPHFWLSGIGGEETDTQTDRQTDR
jgi:hypothetical protein